MSKKLSALALFFALASLFFAQGAPAKVLSAKDLTSFVTNYEAMNAEFDKLGDKYQDLIEQDTEDGSYSSVIASARKTKVPAEIQTILVKYGFGANGFEKMLVITIGCSVLEMEKAVHEQTKGIEMTPEMKPYIDQAKAQVDEMKGAIHKDDLALIKTRQTEIVELLGTQTE